MFKYLVQSLKVQMVECCRCGGVGITKTLNMSTPCMVCGGTGQVQSRIVQPAERTLFRKELLARNY